MESYLTNLTTPNRYDDGLNIDYAMMIRLWSSFDRSVGAFNRNCGVIRSNSSKRISIDTITEEKRRK